jgi:hypothetical protein
MNARDHEHKADLIDVSVLGLHQEEVLGFLPETRMASLQQKNVFGIIYKLHYFILF